MGMKGVCMMKKVYTMADQIRQMSDEELAKMIWKAGRNYRVLEDSPHKDWECYKKILLEQLHMPTDVHKQGLILNVSETV